MKAQAPRAQVTAMRDAVAAGSRYLEPYSQTAKDNAVTAAIESAKTVPAQTKTLPNCAFATSAMDRGSCDEGLGWFMVRATISKTRSRNRCPMAFPKKIPTLNHPRSQA